MHRLHSERGLALALAIFAVVVVGVIVAGALFVGTQENQLGRNSLRQQEAFHAAEAAVEELALAWDPATYNALAVGGSVSADGRSGTGRGWYRRTVQRLNTMLFLVRADGFSRDSAARQRIGMLMRLQPLQFNINAALKTQGEVWLGGSSQVSGRDRAPAGWPGCPDTVSALPGVRLPDASMLRTRACAPAGNPPNYPCIQGLPTDVVADTSISSGSLTKVGDIAFDSLRQFANKVVYASATPQVKPSATNGTCDYGQPYNWGEPYPAGSNPPTPPPVVPECFNYFPIIWVEGNLSANGVRGQGVLIVNGNLAVQGGFEFYGPVLVRGTLSTEGTGGHFTGGVIAANVNLEKSDVLGNASISYSRCTLFRATTTSSSAVPLRDRNWMNLY